MAIVAKSSGNSNFEPLPLGVCQAVCAFVEDIGTHEGSYQNKPISRHQIVIVWELTEKMSDGKPFTVSNFYTLSLNEKAKLLKDLENWRGKAFSEEELAGFDVEKLLGANCMLNIVEHKKLDGNMTQRIGSIMPLLKGMTKIERINTIAPEWISKKRAESVEAQEQQNGNITREPGQDEDMPF